MKSSLVITLSIAEPEKLDGRVSVYAQALVGGERGLGLDHVAWRRGAHVEGEVAAQHHTFGTHGLEEQWLCTSIQVVTRTVAGQRPFLRSRAALPRGGYLARAGHTGSL